MPRHDVATPSPGLLVGAALGVGVLHGLLEAWWMRDHYLLDISVCLGQTMAFVVGLYGLAASLPALGGATAVYLMHDRLLRDRKPSWLPLWAPGAAVGMAALAGLVPFGFGQLWVWHNHVAGSPSWAIGAALGYLVLATCVCTLALLAAYVLLTRAARSWHRLALLGPLGTVALAIVFLVGFATFKAEQDQRLVLFDSNYLTGSVVQLAYRVADRDGDGFAPTWIGGSDPDDSDPAQHVLADIPPLLAGRPTHSLSPEHASQDANLLLITVDTLRADHLGCYGYPRPVTPNLDRLAAEGARFEHAISQWTSTSPSFASILTGTYPHTHGVRTLHTPIRDSNVLLAEPLRDAGFATAGFVHNVNLSPDFKFDQGFMTYQAFPPEAPERALTDTALEWLRRHLDTGAEERFFLWVHYIDPHGPYEPPEPFRGSFEHDVPQPFQRFYMPPPFRTKSSNLRDYIDRYDEELAQIDAEIGRLVGALAEHGLTSSTLVAFTSDHGESFGHNYFGNHGEHTWDSLVHVPLIYRFPGTIPAQQTFDGQVETIDLLPTVLELVGSPPPQQVEGVSQAARLLGLEVAEEDGERYAFIETGATNWLNPLWRQRAVRTSRWKYAWFPGRNVHQLYDLESDPGELNNLYAAAPDIAGQLAEVLRGWINHSLAKSAQVTDPEAELSDEMRRQLEALGYL